jgi:hypothetical protein
MRGDDARAPPHWSLGPLLAWLTVLVTSLGSLLLLAYVATTGGPPWPATPLGNFWLGTLSTELSLVVPAVLVLAGALLATRLGGARSPVAEGWPTAPSGTPTVPR